MHRQFLLSFNIGELACIHTDPYCKLNSYVMNGLNTELLSKPHESFQFCKLFEMILLNDLCIETHNLTKLISVIKCTLIKSELYF